MCKSVLLFFIFLPASYFSKSLHILFLPPVCKLSLQTGMPSTSTFCFFSHAFFKFLSMFFCIFCIILLKNAWTFVENVVLNTYVLCYLLFCINAAIIEVEMRLAEGADLTPHHHYIILSHPITSKIYPHLPPLPPVLSDQQKQRWLL